MIDSRQQLAKVLCDTINVRYDCFSSVSVSRSLGVLFDANLTMSTHIMKAFVILGNRPFPNYLWSRIAGSLVEHRAVMQEVVSSSPAGPTLRVLK